MTELHGKKIGMTHIFTKEGKRCPVTVVETRISNETGSKLLDLKVGDFVDVRGISKGKGFQGGMKRWKWSGASKTHGSMSHRRVGSIGASASPSRVLKGQHMPGHMGNQNVTIQNLQVIKFDKENYLLAIKGAVPGHRNSQLIIKKAKKILVAEVAEPEKKVETKTKPEPKTKPEAKTKPETKTKPVAKTQAKTKPEPKNEKSA